MKQDMQLMDTSETIYISPIALVKMLKHGNSILALEICTKLLLVKKPHFFFGFNIVSEFFFFYFFQAEQEYR